MNIRKTTTFLLLLLSCLVMQAKVEMPHIFSNDMVLQRDRPIKVWGWAAPGEAVEVEFKTQKLKTKADKKGNWSVTLSQTIYGGPYEMLVRGRDNTIRFANILVGDVWICSGQSNMEWVVANANNAEREIADANHPNIRLFTVDKAMNSRPERDVAGEWKMCSPQTVGNFSAVAYFFGRDINRNTNIPIGLINSSWGGTDIETWTSAEMMRTMPQYAMSVNELAKMDLKKAQSENQERKKQFENAISSQTALREGWQNKPQLFTQRMRVPERWSKNELADLNGSVWFKYDLVLPIGTSAKAATLSLGEIDDDDITFVNGKEVGRTIGYATARKYNIAAGTLVGGKNTIVININDGIGDGGLYGAPEDLYVEIGGQVYPLAGTWDYVIEVDSRKYNYTEFSPNAYPTLLYNAMIDPLVQFGIKGAIWYQGENNAAQAQLYRTLFPNMINDWRSKWGYEFPFYWVQLANFMPADAQPPVKSDWAELREAQTMAQLLAKTGEAVTIDIGDANDIHPRNKQEVGRRLSLLALQNDYGKEDIVASGPTYRAMQLEGDKAYIVFDNVATGLLTKNKYGYVEGFSIAEADNKFVWAKAYIVADNKVIVWNTRIKNPVAVRYAWSNNPGDANLYNSEGLPTAPFRTDND